MENIKKLLKAKSFTTLEAENFHMPEVHLHKPAIFLDDALEIFVPLESLVRQTSDLASDEICGCGGKIKSYGIAGEKYCEYCDKAY